jgi:hypothetical protein
MNYDTLANLALTVHISILGGSIAAWYRYGAPPDLFEKSFKGIDEILSTLRMMISNELLDVLRADLRSMLTTPQLITGLDHHASTYSERATNFIESERFREIIYDFVNGEAKVIADYRTLLGTKDSLCFWSRNLRRALLIIIILQILSICIIGYFYKISEILFSDCIIKSALILTSFLVLLVCCLIFPMLLNNQNKITEYRVRYDVAYN